jgi:hypothetical protein
MQKFRKKFVIKNKLLYLHRIWNSLKARHMRENIILTYYRIGKSEGCLAPVPTDFWYGFLISILWQ